MYEIDMRTIRFSNGKEHKFSSDIAEAIDFDDTIVVRLDAHPLAFIQNVFGLDYRGNLRWQIPQWTSFVTFRPYVGIYRQGENVEALNWDGHTVTLDPRRGFILAEGYYGGGVTRARRHPTPRRWL
jgi:hypothetical protein